MIKVKCNYCGKTCKKSPGHYNRAIKLNAGLYCNRRCAWNGRKMNPEEKHAIQLWYWLFFRISKSEDKKIFDEFRQAFYFHLDYRFNPEKYKKERKRRMPEHVKYCRRPEYKKYKHQYDIQYHAKKKYGDYWEAAIVLNQLENEIDKRQGRRENKLYNKSTGKRKRLWQKMQKQGLNLQPLI